MLSWSKGILQGYRTVSVFERHCPLSSTGDNLAQRACLVSWGVECYVMVLSPSVTERLSHDSQKVLVYAGMGFVSNFLSFFFSFFLLLVVSFIAFFVFFVCLFFCSLFVGWLLNVPATCECIRDGSAQAVLRAATLRLKLQTKLSISPSHSILTPGGPVPVLTLKRQEPGRVATGVPILKSLV